jgi:hypothetical protein
VLVNQVEQNLVRRKITFSSRTLENLPVHIIVKIIVKQLFFLQAPENLVLPKQIPLQPVRLMNLKHKHDVRQVL